MAIEDIYKKKQEIYKKYFSFGTMTGDFSNRVALISLMNYLFLKLKEKKKDLTMLDLLKSITKNMYGFPEKNLHSIAIICEDLGYSCEDFPTFDLKSDKEIIAKIKELLNTWLPF